MYAKSLKIHRSPRCQWLFLLLQSVSIIRWRHTRRMWCCPCEITLYCHLIIDSHTLINIFQICQVANFAPDTSYDIADVGTEEMWIDTDGTPYLFYTGPSNRCCAIVIWASYHDIGWLVIFIMIGRLKYSFIVINQQLPQQRLLMETMQSFFTMYVCVINHSCGL